MSVTHPHPGTPSKPRGMALFALGFRPFFLAAGIYAVLLMGLWLVVLQGSLSLGALPPPSGTAMKCCSALPWP